MPARHALVLSVLLPIACGKPPAPAPGVVPAASAKPSSSEKAPEATATPRTETRDVPCMKRSEQPKPTSTRLAVANELLAKGPMMIYLDPKPSGVVVPERFKKDVRLILVMGHDTHIPIPDLKTDADGISGTLSFDRTPFFCKIPWSAVFALTTDEESPRGQVWPDAVPSALWCKE